MKRKNTGARPIDPRIAAAIARFPKEFGLRAFPGRNFKIDPRSCHIDDDGQVILEVVVELPAWEDSPFGRVRCWESFAGGFVEELLQEAIKASKES